ncbi:MAG: ABC transporter ATP-binding protein [Malacoplasma sp.]
MNKLLHRKNNKKSLEINLNNIEDKAIVEMLTTIKKEHISNEKLLIDSDRKDAPILEVKNLNKFFGNNDNRMQALKDINFKIYQNEHIAILGGNGAGKTTLSEIIAGVNKQDSGEIKYNLGQVRNFKEKIGIQFQDSSYPSGITVKRVVTFISDVYKSNLSVDQLNALIEIFGIDKFYNKKASSLSGGQQQRLNCLLAIIHMPKLVILDELSTGLDVNIRYRIKTFIKSYAKENDMTILLVSHDMDEVEYIADRIIVMVKGEIFINASKTEIINKYGSINNCINMYI